MTDRLRTSAAEVLLVEDDEALRTLLRMALQVEGFVVREADNGAEALEIFRLQAGDVGLVLADVRCLGVDCIQTVRELRRLAPGLPVCFMTRGVADGTEVEAQALRPEAVFTKPFSLFWLVETVSQILREPHPLSA